jgi:hypothetical protein
LAELAVRADKRLSAGAARFLAGRDYQHDAGRPCQPIGERNASNDESRDATFHIRRAAPVKLAVRDVGCKWIRRPGLCAKGYSIEMAGESERQPARLPADTRKNLRPPFAEGN